MYHYETLGDERFQELCQALICRDFPTAQCLPVGQPDGGRDALLYGSRPKGTGETREFDVFQVKYVKSPTGNRSERDAILELVRTEGSKVERLKKMGLKRYFLVTNVKGTAHLEVGAIDTLNAELSKLLEIPAQCWWRDDLDRRLDSSSEIKWSYPEVLKATDLLGVLVKGQLGEDEGRRRDAVRAYLTSQFEDDLELKFKQTDLRSSMTELFVDLPMLEASPDQSEEVVITHRGSGRHFVESGKLRWTQHEARHAADFFLMNKPDKRYSRVLLEGAPGQGKSTVTQFSCQVMRMLMLDKHNAMKELPKQYSSVMARLPFRVDLRDLAKWLAGFDPFQPKVVALDEREVRSLEGFLAAQIRHASGGASFNVSDLIAVAKAAHLFIALDGFDEVADVSMRNTLVSEITKATSRLMNAGSFSVQTVVTSRPAAFAKSVRFSREQWSYFHLLPLERSHVDAYANKWMKAKALKTTERQSLLRVLNEKLEETHTKYLAKNPMQLTILLSLINNRGSSLPEKRTALYDAYMDMFFSRESEKSDVVRDNRELLIDIHRFLAWKLQTDAEAGGDGSIEHSELRKTLFSYLDNQGEDTSIINGLFDGIIERVGALVSRVQETYEFEVQPLREYFAARHLYETAPYNSSAVGEYQDSKLDRFQALARNPYWLNVTRFYGGCFSKGEVSALVDELIVLSKDAQYSMTSHPRSMAMVFLTDWVFSQYQPAVKRVVDFIAERPHLRQLIASEQPGTQSGAPLPDRSGKQEFVERLWDSFLQAAALDERRALAQTISLNTSPSERLDLWEILKPKMSEDDWISYGTLLGLFKAVPEEVYGKLPKPLSPAAIKALLDSMQFELLSRDEVSRSSAQKMVLDGGFSYSSAVLSQPLLDCDIFWTARILVPFQYALDFADGSDLPLKYLIDRTFTTSQKRLDWENLKVPTGAIGSAVSAYLKFIEYPLSTLQSSAEPWSALVEALRNAWGDHLTIDCIANIAARHRVEKESKGDVKFSGSIDLLRAFRSARMKSGAPRWWQTTLDREKHGSDIVQFLLAFWVWATPRTIFSLAQQVDPILRSLSDTDWDKLRLAYSRCQTFLPARTSIGRLERAELEVVANLGARAAILIGFRCDGDIRSNLVPQVLADSQASQPELNFAMNAILNSLRGKQMKPDVLPLIRSLYTRGASSFHPVRRDDFNLSSELALTILSSIEEYPLSLVASADFAVKSRIGESAAKLSDVASQQGWFSFR